MIKIYATVILRALLIVSAIFQLSSCSSNSGSSQQEQVETSKKDSIAYNLFISQNNTYGFDVTVNGNVYIHQPFMPTKQGRNGFKTKHGAETIAALITERLKDQDYRFLLTEADINKLLQSEKKPLRNAVEKSTGIARINREASTSADINTTVFQIPSLPDAPVKSQWKSIGVLPFGKRMALLGFGIGNYIFMGAGQVKDEMTNDFWCYNSVTNAWTCLATMPGGVRISGIAFALNGKGFIGLGSNGATIKSNFRKDLYEYDPEKNTWTKKADFAGTSRVDAVAFVLNDKAYVGTGYDNNYCRDFYEYDPIKNSWRRIADFGGGPVSSSMAVSTGSHGFLVAGDRVPENKKFVYEYLPTPDKWEKRRDFPGHPRYFLTGSNIDSNLFIAGGGGAEGGDMRFKDYFIYNVSKNKWSPMPDYPTKEPGSARPCVSNIKGDIYMGGGFDGSYSNDWNVFEYYFKVRTDRGLYYESSCYPLKYDGTWELYQECTDDDCYAGAAIKTTENLGDFCYKSLLDTSNEKLILYDEDHHSTHFLLLPRKFSMSFEKKAKHTVGIRLFVTKEEVEELINAFEKSSGSRCTIQDIKILQRNAQRQYEHQANDDLKNYRIISPDPYSYGVQQQTIVFSFDANDVLSEFYIALQIR